MKKFFKWIKSNIVAVSLIVLVVVIATAGTSMAYFSDNKEMTNVFTAGNVYISLTEAAVKSDGAGNLIEDTDSPRVAGVAVDAADKVTHNFGMLFPGKVMHKDPTVTNTGDEAAWIAVKLILTDGSGDINRILGYENSQEIDIRSLLYGGLLAESYRVGTWNGFEDVAYNDSYAMVHVPDARSGVYEFYIFLNTALLSGESVEIFDTMMIAPEFTNADMQEMAELEITVQAFAVQTFGFNDCYTAMCRAFPTHFANVGGTAE